MGTPTMIDNVAKAIANTNSRDVNPNWRMWREHARAVLEALREPTPAMIEASNREWDGRMSHRSSGAWQAMIDAALNETSS